MVVSADPQKLCNQHGCEVCESLSILRFHTVKITLWPTVKFPESKFRSLHAAVQLYDFGPWTAAAPSGMLSLPARSGLGEASPERSSLACRGAAGAAFLVDDRR